MFKRLWWLMVGAGFGFGSSFWVMRRIQQFVQRWTPAGLRDRVTLRLDELGMDLRDAAEAGRQQMTRREAELRGQIHPHLTPVPPALAAATAVADHEVVEAELLPVVENRSIGHPVRRRRRSHRGRTTRHRAG